MISYEPLEHTLIRRQMNRERLFQDGVLTRATIAKFRKRRYVSLEVIDRLCAYLQCRVEDVIEYVDDE